MSDGQSILNTCLLDLLHELRDYELPLILAGGYGLYLKQVHLQEAPPSRTLIPGNLWPAPRATEDLDILLTTEVVVDPQRMRPIRAALDRLEYAAVPGGEYMQFAKPVGGGRVVKVDLLTGPLGLLENDPRIRVDDRRVRLRDSVKLHAHRTDEALAFEQDLLRIPVRGVLSHGQEFEAIVHVPQAFTLLLMKLAAFRDRCADAEKNLARHHALDLYRIVAMLTEKEFSVVRRRIAENAAHPVIVQARRTVVDHFATAESLGALRVREHPLWNQGMALGEFLSALADLFQSPK